MASSDHDEAGRADSPAEAQEQPENAAPNDDDNNHNSNHDSARSTPVNPSPTERPRSQLMFPPAPPSIISSRMTDMGSDDGMGTVPDAGANRRRSGYASDLASRPPTARTGVSSARSAYPGPNSPPQPLRKHALTAGKRGSTGAGSIASSIGRTPSVKSHAPLASAAFFHPMSSQKLQAQRAQSRHQQLGGALDDPAAITEMGAGSVTEGGKAGNNGWRQSVTSTMTPNPNPVARVVSDASSQWQAPPSRGTEVTGFETIDRATANTSPVHGHRVTSSVAESLRPLQRLQDRDAQQEQDQHLTVDTGRSFRDNRANAPSPIRTPLSFRSSFLLPGLGEGSRNGSNRDVQGAEKLPSAASTPRVRPVDLNKPETHSRPTWRQRRAERRQQGKVHQYFDGNTFFCLGGRFQNSRQKPINIATGAFIIIPCVLFFIFEAPWHWHNLSPAVPLTFGYVFYLCVSSFIHASVTDPGILPRNLHPFPPDNDDDPLHIGPPTNDWTLVKSSEKSTAAMEVPVKYCRTCNIWRPPRAHHCRLCDNCIETHDHHCVWLNNCIGRRNYRHFFVFVSSATILGLYLSIISLVQLTVHSAREHVSFGDALNLHRVTFGLLVYGLVGFAYPAALMTYHIFLMARGETTREFINSHKFVKKERYRAFTQGAWILNWVSILCRPRPPTYYGFKNQYQKGDQRLASRRRAGWLQPVPQIRRVHPPAVEMQNVKPVSQGTSNAPTG